MSNHPAPITAARARYLTVTVENEQQRIDALAARGIAVEQRVLDILARQRATLARFAGDAR